MSACRRSARVGVSAAVTAQLGVHKSDDQLSFPKRRISTQSYTPPSMEDGPHAHTRCTRLAREPTRGTLSPAVSLGPDCWVHRSQAHSSQMPGYLKVVQTKDMPRRLKGKPRTRRAVNRYDVYGNTIVNATQGVLLGVCGSWLSGGREGQACSPTCTEPVLAHFECRGAPARVRVWRCEGRPPLGLAPPPLVCVETLTLPYLTLR